MKPTVRLASAAGPGGSEFVLYQQDCDFSIRVDGQELMNSRQHESELELARLGCARLVGREAPRILIGGLGLGYTLRQALEMLGPDAQVVVSELMDEVVKWNREYLGELNGHPLRDERVSVEIGDVVDLILGSMDSFDAILLDIDNGPDAISESSNWRLYGAEGVWACHAALRERGCLAVWSAEPSKKFERTLMSVGFHVRRYRASAYKGSKSQSRFVWVASEDKSALPPGGGEPRSGRGGRSRGGGRGTRKRR